MHSIYQKMRYSLEKVDLLKRRRSISKLNMLQASI